MSDTITGTQGQVGTGMQTGVSGAPKHLVVLSQTAPTVGRIYRLHKERIVLGSVVSADVQVQGDGISPIHAVIEISTEGNGSPKAMIFDLASDTGVFINGTKHITATIRTGDEITIGRFRLKFAIEDPNAIRMTERVNQTSDGRKLIMDEKEDLKSLLLQEEREVYEIFDYRPASKTALESVMSWSSTILDVQHFVDEKTVTVGADRSADFAIPSNLPSPIYSIASKSGEGYSLALDSSMKGVVQRQGQLLTIEQFKQVTGSTTLNLGKNEFAKLKIGDIDFYFSYTAAPPRLKSRRLMERDPFMHKVFFASMAFTAAFIFAASRIELSQNIEVEQVPERLATIIYQPIVTPPKPKVETPPPVPKEKEVAAPVEKQPEPKQTVKVEVKPQTKPKEVPKTIQVSKNVADKNQKGGATQRAQSEAKEGAGARAKGAEGQRGSKTAAANKEHQEAAKRPSPQGGKGRGGGQSQVQDQGNVDLLKGAATAVQNILGNTNAKFGTGGSELKGFGNFSTLGKGGQALSGEGKGGGGDAEGLGGLADKGRGGGRVGTGMGAAGKGSGVIGGASRVALRMGGDGEGVVAGSMDLGAIAAAIEAHKDAFRYCYEKEVNAGLPKLAGSIKTTFVIGSSGRVNEAGITNTTMNNANVERCVLGVLKRIDFPIPQGGVVQVGYPFKFSRLGGG